MTTVSTRLAGATDLDGIAVLFDAYRQFYAQAPDSGLARSFIGERFQRQESVLIVAENAHGELVGFCQLYPTYCSVAAAPIFVLYDLFVSPAARGTGAGRALMLAADAHGADSGAARMELSTATDNIVAQALYESCGWQRNDAFFVYSRSLRR